MSLVAFVVSFTVLCYVEIRVAFLAFLLLVWYLAFAHVVGRRVPNVWKLVVGVGLFALLNAYWIVEAVGISRSSIASTTARGIFGNNFTNFEHAITLVSGSWVNGSIVPFTLGPIGVVMWVLPILAIAGASMKSAADAIPRWAVCTFAGAIAIAGVMLGTQANPPFSSLFPWVYNHVPGFSLFRTGTDFLIVAGLGYGILIGRLFSTRTWSTSDFKKLTYKTVSVIGLAVVVLSTLIPLVDGRVGSLFEHRTEPSGLARVENFIGHKESFFRTLWLPDVPNWSTFSLSHPAVGGADLLAGGQPLEHSVAFGTTTGSATVKQLSSHLGRDVLQKYSVRYVILPPSDSPNLGPLYSYYGEPRSFYLHWLERQPWLKQVPGFNGGYSVFHVIDPHSRSLISVGDSGSSTRSFVVNSELLVSGLATAPASGSTVDASMLYNPNWRAYLVPLNELGGVCQISQGKVVRCGVGSAYRVLFDISTSSWKPMGSEMGSSGQLQFRVTSAAQTSNLKRTGQMAIVMVFGSAFETWSLFYLAQIVLVALALIALTWFVFRRRRRSRTDTELTESDTSGQ
jgi:hypothetical protein